MPTLNDSFYLALFEKRKNKLLTDTATVKNVKREETYDTRLPYFVLEVRTGFVRRRQSSLIFPVDAETEKIGNLKKGEKIVLKRCCSDVSKIAEIAYENGELIFSLEDPSNGYIA